MLNPNRPSTQESSRAARRGASRPRAAPHRARPDAAIDTLVHGDLDLAVTHAYSNVPELPSQGLFATPLVTEEVVLAAATSRTPTTTGAGAARLAEQAHSDWVTAHPEQGCAEMVKRACGAAGFQPSIVAEATDFSVQLQLVAADIGVALLPRLAARGLPEGVQLHPLHPGSSATTSPSPAAPPAPIPGSAASSSSSSTTPPGRSSNHHGRSRQMLLAAYRGRETDAASLLKRVIDSAAAKGEGLGVQYAQWATAVLCNGLGRYEEALVAARQAASKTPELFIAEWSLIEAVEAGIRSGNIALAAEAADRLAGALRTIEADWALGMTARAHALVAEADAAERLYAEAIIRLGRTSLGPELARTHLLYGEWLRRAGRRVDAREELRAAHDIFTRLGMEAFGERAGRELRATGATARKRSADTRDDLTPQEHQIAGLARDGLSNPEIAGMLYLSPRTFEYHMRKVLAKLGISSRYELRAALPGT